MKKTVLLLCGLSLGMLRGGAQELKMIESAPLTQVYGEISESDELLPMNDVGMEFGYVLYEAAVTVPEGEALLELNWKTCATTPRSTWTGSSKGP